MVEVSSVFIDRDGVINVRPDFERQQFYILKQNDFVFEKKAIEGLKMLSDSGLPIIVVTNQSCVGRGLISEKDIAEMHTHMTRELAVAGVKITDVLFCPHTPEAGCGCRKPEIGLLVDAAKKWGVSLGNSWMLGDMTSDIKAGRLAGCKTILVKTGCGGEDKKFEETPDFVAADLIEAAKIVLGGL
jgi:histidinol-phosphate phosphatase family protein